MTLSPSIMSRKLNKMTPFKNGKVEADIYKLFENMDQAHSHFIYLGTNKGGYTQWPKGLSASKYDPRSRP